MCSVHKNRRILFFISEDWYFWSHRLPLARAARDLGWDVTITTRSSNLKEKIRNEKFKLIPLKKFKRRIQSPLRELQSLLELVYIYRKVRPDIVHHVALKPVIYGTIAARCTGVRGILNALAGLGFLFTSESKTVSFIQRVALLLLRVLFTSRNVRLILQNTDDLNLMISNGVVKRNQALLIRGSGVDLQLYRPGSEPSGLPIVLLPSRMLWDKGIREFVNAARLINASGQLARFVLVGAPDPENPASIPRSQLKRWHASEVVESWGHQSNMSEVFAQASIVCLPSYREGLPKALLEGAACGRPIVTTNTTGCRDVVCCGKNGFLVPVRNSIELANAIRVLLDDPKLRASMGTKGREIVMKEFSEEKVVRETIALYSALSE